VEHEEYNGRKAIHGRGEMSDAQGGLYARIEEATASLKERVPRGWSPEVGLILGSGLGPLADEVDALEAVPYKEIPGFAQSSVAGHAGRLVLGTLEGVNVAVMQGRLHYYEGHSLQQVTFPVRVLKALGAGTLVVTNAAGGLNPELNRGDLMLIEDHINLLGWGGANPLLGENDDRLGTRFPDIKPPYDPKLITLAEKVARERNITVRRGVYIIVAGPSFETRAELRLLRQWGADAVGMSTVPEVIVARHAGMRVLGVSNVTNMALGDEPVTHEEVQEAGQEAGPRLITLVRGVLARMRET
jgi:purine-nucleoside phosphorylase